MRESRKNIPPWDVHVRGMDTGSISQGGIQDVLRLVCPGESLWEVMNRVGRAEFGELIDKMEDILIAAIDTGALHERQNWLSPISKWMGPYRSCWQCRFCWKHTINSGPDDIEHHEKCFLMTGLSKDLENRLNVQPIPGVRRCSVSFEEVRPSKNVRGIICGTCGFVADVVPYEHKSYGPSWMLAEHYCY